MSTHNNLLPSVDGLERNDLIFIQAADSPGPGDVVRFIGKTSEGITFELSVNHKPIFLKWEQLKEVSLVRKAE
jgi:ureidoglycolate hydrolase